jgi:acyl-CoA synthetase (AMP-forming)/AMP-acid ligase II
MHFADLFEAIADTLGERDALACGGDRRTWQEYETRASRLARAFMEAGLGAGSKVGFYLYNGNEYCEAYFATLKIRGCAVNINYRYVDEELRYLIEYSDAEALVYPARSASASPGSRRNCRSSSSSSRSTTADRTTTGPCVTRRRSQRILRPRASAARTTTCS